jgi:hypothetical protein
MLVGSGPPPESMQDWPPAWRKVPMLIDALGYYDEVVWFDADLVVVDPSEDFPPMVADPARGVFMSHDYTHALVRHFENDSEVPNSGVWRLRPPAIPLLSNILELKVFQTHGWFEQAALMTLMGYTVPPEGSEYHKTRCKQVQMTKWGRECLFMRLKWNSHPNFRHDKPKIIHCSYKDMQTRIDTMRALVLDPHYNYPKYDQKGEDDEKKVD